MQKEVIKMLNGDGWEYYLLFLHLALLQDFTIIDINAQSLTTPSTIEDLQKNYIEFEDRGLDINLR